MQLIYNMQIPRIYQNQVLAVDQLLLLNDSAKHHLLNVLRLNTGAKLIIFNGEKGQFSGSIQSINKQRCEVLLESFADIDHESPLTLHLGQVISKGERMDFTIQKAVELGVSQITPLFSERCNVKLNAERLVKRMDHWQKIMIHACEQCNRNRLPILHPALSLEQWLLNSSAQLKLILHPEGQSLSTLASRQSITDIQLVIGPEGGLTDQEIQLASNQQFTTIQLGHRILRTETAAIAAITACQFIWGDF